MDDKEQSMTAGMYFLITRQIQLEGEARLLEQEGRVQDSQRAFILAGMNYLSGLDEQIRTLREKQRAIRVEAFSLMAQYGVFCPEVLQGRAAA